ncbi:MULTISPECIES: hypothetical protein [Akkermansia]|jgi:hypothetical protein|uniref:Uncharacterized protein n=1 Tax=Akkermansia massiliensis TaxID=2927224 RepID=A0ABT0RB53_9BACT|nr:MULTISPECIES: hypothetical protein [Akkermansia]MBT8779923.1 hypothetical protein [Akkermansia muciniphila]MBP8661987.1 hypothetical protein [Akkermansia sp.]MBP9525784.1 hypothetical protein [Akkermansia sp.]MBT8784528.1 hypothetical protein [Akkermansia muciniphila]MBT9603380.1 hypothetical protein [Akkermansia muciniphila]
MRDSAREIEMETARTAPRAEKKEKLINLELLFRGILNKNTASGNKQKRSGAILLYPGKSIPPQAAHPARNKKIRPAAAPNFPASAAAAISVTAFPKPSPAGTGTMAGS